MFTQTMSAEDAWTHIDALWIAKNYPEMERVAAEWLQHRSPEWRILYALGYARKARKDYRAALSALCQAAELQDQNAELWNSVGACEVELQHTEAALAAFGRALELNPCFVSALVNLAALHRSLRQYPEALACAEQAVAIDPQHRRAWTIIGNACHDLGRFLDAERAFRRVMQLDPDHLTIHCNLAITFFNSSRVDEAIAILRGALARNPGHRVTISNLLFSLPYYDAFDPANAAADYQLYRDLVETPFAGQWVDPGPAGRMTDKIRLGIVSADWYSHSVMYFMEPLLVHLDRGRYEIYCYDNGYRPLQDSVRERVLREVDHYRQLAGSIDERVARLRADHLHLVIDASGHTAYTGLDMLAQRVAPLQMTWLGYPGSSGLNNVDWRFTDGEADPPTADAEYTERLLRLADGFCVYRPCITNPLQRYWPAYQVRPTPALANGYITFGSCNNVAKLQPSILAVWARILAALPTARLLIEARGVDDPQLAAVLSERCAKHGIPPDRLILLPRQSANQYLTYHGIDIALDTSPLNGGTTTFDVLWMGVPLVTLSGRSFRGRMGRSLLSALDRREWIAASADEYVQIACELAGDVPRLNEIRLAQRRRMEASPLMAEAEFVRQFERGIEQALSDAGVESAETSALPVTRWVFLADGRVRLDDAHERLAGLLRQAAGRPVEAAEWQQVLTLANSILESHPQDACALRALADIEEANDNVAFAEVYREFAAGRG